MTTLMFPGQGSQYRGMGKSLFAIYPKLVEQANDLLGYRVDRLCLEDTGEKLNSTEYTQPALYVVNALSFQHHIDNDGAPPTYFLGHSLGEYNALHASGVVSFIDGLAMVKERGRLMSQAPKGAMAAVLKVSLATLRASLEAAKLDTIDIANINSQEQFVISGLSKDIAAAEAAMSEDAIFVPLNTSGAFHSRYMKPAKESFERFLTNFQFNTGSVPVVANTSAKLYAFDEVASTLANQITHPVRWLDSINYLRALGQDDFIELGPGNVLTKLCDYIRSSEIPINTAKVESSSDSVESSVEEAIDYWNKSYKVGTPVQLGLNDDIEHTRSEAMLLFGKKAVIYLKGRRCFFDLGDVSPVS